MAEKRMFSKAITDSDPFLDMPISSQCLYFHLAMWADDDGFVNCAKRVMRSLGASDDDMRVLASKQFVILFPSGVLVIRHWRLHNNLRKDRYKPTIYKDELNCLCGGEGKEYNHIGNQMATVGIPDGNQTATQYSIDKNSIYIPHSADREKPKKTKNNPEFDARFDEFWKSYPRKVAKQDAQKAFMKIAPDDEILSLMLKALAKEKKSEQWREDRFIPYPATWLNGKRWEDDREEETQFADYGISF